MTMFNKKTSWTIQLVSNTCSQKKNRVPEELDSSRSSDFFTDTCLKNLSKALLYLWQIQTPWTIRFYFGTFRYYFFRYYLDSWTTWTGYKGAQIGYWFSDFTIVIPKGLRMPREEITFTARPKIHTHSQIYRYGRSIFCLPQRPKFSDIFDLCLHWVSVVRAVAYILSSPFLKTISLF